MRGDEHHRHLLVDQRDRAVFHLRCRVALSVDIADLLQFERALQRGRKAVAAAQVQKILRALEFLGDFLDFASAVEDVLNLGRERLHLFDDRFSVDHRQRAKPGQLQGEEKQRDYLAGKRLRRSDADLRPGVDVNTAVALARDRRPDDVDYAIGLRASRFGFAHRGEGIGSLAGLRNHNAERPVIDDRIAVAKLGSIFDFDGDAGEVLEHVLADKRRMPARATGGDQDVVEPEQLLVRHVETAELRGALIRQQSSAHAVLDCSGLLEDFLEHEVIEPATLDLIQVPVDLADAPLELLRALVQNRVSVARKNGDVSVIQIDDLSGMRENRGDVTRDVVLAVAEPNQERTAFSCSDNLVSVPAGDDGYPVSPFDLPEGLDNRVLKIPVERFLDQMRDDFGVGLRGELVPARLESLLERA